MAEARTEHPSGGDARDRTGLQRRDGSQERLTSGGLLLGIRASGEYTEGRVRLAPGDTLLAYTDGVTEARSPADEEFGEERLAAFVARAAGQPLEAMLSALETTVSEFRGQRTFADDFTLLAARVDEGSPRAADGS